MAPAKSFHVAIVGGGIAGVTLAIALHSRQIAVTIYEQAQAFGEVGAGVAFGPNALQAMELCHHGIYEAFEKIRTTNLWPSKQKVWFDFYDGYESKKADGAGCAFSFSNGLGQNGVHRAHFLNELVKLIPKEIAQFNKQLEEIREKLDGKLKMTFTDGTSADADVIIGCDGIKSRVRQVILGKDHPSAHPSYTHKYAYRGLVPMEIAIHAIGAEKAQNACIWMGSGGHVLTFSVNHGKTLNIVAFYTSKDEWADYPRLIRTGTREEALRDFADYGHDVTELLKLVEPELSVWAIYDLGDHPVPTFAKGRIAISGDAAHATSPHHGAGAGFCLEDSAVLLSLLTDERVHSHDSLQAALAAFDSNRRERAQWLVQSSRFMGDCFELQAPGAGNDFKKIEAETTRRIGIVSNVDVQKMCEEAKEVLGRLLSAEKSRLA